MNYTAEPPKRPALIDAKIGFRLTAASVVREVSFALIKKSKSEGE